MKKRAGGQEEVIAYMNFYSKAFTTLVFLFVSLIDCVHSAASGSPFSKLGHACVMSYLWKGPVLGVATVNNNKANKQTNKQTNNPPPQN